MGILDFIFGDKDDSVEDATPSHPLETVPGWQRPIGATTNDQQVGEDDMGNPVFRTTLGGTYTVRVNPDQRTIRQKVEDAAPAVVDAVKDYAQNPTLPSKEAVGQFAYDATIGAAQELDALMFENDGTIGDVLATATAAGTGGMVASRALQEPMENAMGMFLNVRTPNVDSDSLKEAKDMARQGVDRDEIWKKTGWGRVAGEWVTESDDSQSGIMLTDKYRPRPGIMEEKTVEKTVTTAPDRNQRISAKTNARVRRNEIMAKMQSGELSREEGLAQLKALETELEGNLQGQTQTVTETVKVQKPATALKSTGTLSEVLGNDELTPFLDGKDPPATVGVAYKSAGSLGSYDPNTKLIKAYDQKDLPNTRNDADQLIRDELDNIKAKYGENSPEYKVAYSNAIADAIWSTTLHEVQHYIQDVNDFLGQGSNLEDAAKIAKIIKKDFAAGVKDIADQQPVKALMKELASISAASKFGVKVPNTRAARIEILEYLYAYEEVMRQGMAEDEAFAALLPELRKSYGILRPEAEQLINYVKQDPELIGSMSDFTDLQNSTVGMINRLGGNNFDIYRHDAGEVMSRLTQARRNMSAKERREKPPWTMYKEVGVFDEGAIYSADDMLRQKSYSWDADTDFLDKSIDNFNTIRQIFDVDEEYAKEVATQVLSGDPFSDIISDDQFEQLKNSIYLKTQDLLKDYPDEITVYRAGDVPEGTVRSFTLNPNYDPDFVGNAPGSKGAPLVAYTVKKSDILASPDITARGPIGEDEVIINTNSVRLSDNVMDGTEYFSPEDLDIYLRQAKNPASRETIVYLSPQQFLDLAEPLDPDGSTAIEKSANVRSVLESGTKLDSIPSLSFEHDGKGTAQITGHEGRNRARVLLEMGVTRIPVRMNSVAGGGGRGIRWGKASDPNESFDYIPPEELPTVLVNETGTESYPMIDSDIYPVLGGNKQEWRPLGPPEKKPEPESPLSDEATEIERQLEEMLLFKDTPILESILNDYE